MWRAGRGVSLPPPGMPRIIQAHTERLQCRLHISLTGRRLSAFVRVLMSGSKQVWQIPHWYAQARKPDSCYNRRSSNRGRTLPYVRHSTSAALDHIAQRLIAIKRFAIPEPRATNASGIPASPYGRTSYAHNIVARIASDGACNGVAPLG
jgi:hypothetical protein